MTPEQFDVLMAILETMNSSLRVCMVMLIAVVIWGVWTRKKE